MDKQQLCKYVDGELTPEERTHVATQVAADPELRSELAAQLQTDCLLKVLLGDPASDRRVVESVLGVLQSESTDELTGSVLSDLRPRATRPVPTRTVPGSVVWLRRLAFAACLTLVAGLWWLNRQQAGMRLRIVDLTGSVTVMRGASSIPAGAGMGLLHGDRVMVREGGKAVLRYAGENTSIELHDATAKCGATEDGVKRLDLESGLLVCTAAPQKEPFLIETPHAVAEVVGTRFWLDVVSVQTTLAVRDGTVALRQGEKRLEVNAGETAVADASGMRKLSPEDAWILELLVRARTGPWDVVNLGTGVYSNDVWRMDARGGPAERRIWNMPLESDRAGMVSFRDGKRWARGVVVGRMMILPESQAALEVGDGAATAPAIGWVVHGFRTKGAPDAWQKLQRAAVTLSYGRPPEREWNTFCEILKAGEHQTGVWYHFAVYFDMETQHAHHVFRAAWPEGATRSLPASEWVLQRFESKGNSEVEIGLMAKGVLMVAQGLKFVPLGPDMPLPPKELLERK